MFQDFSRETMKLFIENKLDQNIQPVNLSSMHSEIDAYKSLGLLSPYFKNFHLDEAMQIRFVQHR